jgi:ABC-type multidrug transport system fused ATPase/permease subunit
LLSVEGNSLERIQGYINIEKEPETRDSGVPAAHWPSSGHVRVENLTARYSPDGPIVLDGINFTIESGQRVGVGTTSIYCGYHVPDDTTVGRTGSGKSTLTLSLLRCIFTEGEVYYDGVPTSSLNLDALRSKITIIPQVVGVNTCQSVTIDTDFP